MQQFSIRQVEQLSGIKAHTIRIWEKRYKLIVPGRSEGKQRTYSNEDLKSILRVVYLYKRGLKISKIAKLSENEIIKGIHPGVERGADPEGVMPVLIEACLDLDGNRIEEIFDDLQNRMEFERFVLAGIYPFLEIIGRAWMTSRLFPNNEHFVSHIVSSRIILETGRLRKNPDGAPTVLLFQPLGEYHEIPLLFINYQLLKSGCKTVYFGSNICQESIAYYCRHKPVDYILYHTLTNLGEPGQPYFDEFCGLFPDQKVVASGPAIHDLEENRPNGKLLKSQLALNAFIKNIHSRFEGGFS